MVGIIRVASLLQFGNQLIQSSHKLRTEHLTLGLKQLLGAVWVGCIQKLIDEPDLRREPLLQQAYDHIGQLLQSLYYVFSVFSLSVLNVG